MSNVCDEPEVEWELNVIDEEIDDVDWSIAPAEMSELGKVGLLDSLPEKSKVLYEKKYEQFMSWCSEKDIHKISENILLDYFSELAKVKKSPTLWSTYSMLKSTLQIKNNICIKGYRKLKAFLKREAAGYKSTFKSKTLSRDEITQFLLNAPDKEYLMKKVVLIFGIAGGCQRDELAKMSIDDVQDKESVIIVNVSDSISNKSRYFIISNNNEDGVDYLTLCRTYFKRRPQSGYTKRLFLKYNKGVCTNQVFGKNSIAKIPKQIAEFLDLPQPNMYTSHCFRKTSNLLMHKGGDRTRLKSHEGWRKPTVAETDIELSVLDNPDTTYRSLEIACNLNKMEKKTSDVECSNAPDDNSELTKYVTLNLLPLKSKRKYEKQYELFMLWCSDKGICEISEKVLMDYFLELSQAKKSPTLWSIYSMLKSTIYIKNEIGIENYKKLLAFLKREAVGYKSVSKSKSLTEAEVRQFLLEAPDREYLMKKVVLIFGIAGDCVQDELVKMTIDDIQDEDSVIIVNVSDSPSKKSRYFIISNKNDNEDSVDYLSLCRKYFKTRPQEGSTRRLFLKYNKGVCTNQVVGRNTLAKIPKAIAEYLELPQPEMYTGHCFRSTSSTLLVNKGGDKTQSKGHRSWRSTCGVDVEESFTEKITPAQRILEVKCDLNARNEETSDVDYYNASEDKNELGKEGLTLLPRKSKQKYEKQYEQFMLWCGAKSVSEISENVLMEYFIELSKVKKSPTLWSIYSMLKSTIQIKNEVGIESYRRLLAFLKQEAVGYKSVTKSKTLTKDEMRRFLLEAPDREYLMKKVVLIFGIAGACLRDELVKLTIDDVQDKDSVIIVNVTDSLSRKNRYFIISNKNNNEDSVDYLSLCRKYFKTRPRDGPTRRLFLKYNKGVCTNQVVGTNTIAKIPKAIAEYLKLPQPEMYTGHCFRRTSSSLVNKGGDRFLKRPRDWTTELFTDKIVPASRILGATSEDISNRTRANALYSRNLGQSFATTSSSLTPPVHIYTDAFCLVPASKKIPGQPRVRVDEWKVQSALNRGAALLFSSQFMTLCVVKWLCFALSTMSLKTSTVKCCYKLCRNSYKTVEGLKMFRFPKKNHHVWVVNCGNAELIGISPLKLYKNKKVCSKHFNEEDILPSGRLIEGAVPIPFEHEESSSTDVNNLISL